MWFMHLKLAVISQSVCFGGTVRGCLKSPVSSDFDDKVVTTNLKIWMNGAVF
jgi:hypothetical protein